MGFINSTPFSYQQFGALKHRETILFKIFKFALIGNWYSFIPRYSVHKLLTAFW